MAQKVLIQLVDDIDGTEADETVTFGLDGRQYELDLSGKNANKLRTALRGYVEVARPAKKSGTVKVKSSVDNKAVRRWAAENGIEVSPQGRIPQAVVDQYTAAAS